MLIVVLTIQMGMITIMKSYLEKDNRWENFKERLDCLKESVDAHYLVESLGFKITKETPKELRASCVIHNGDNQSAFRFNKDSGTWVCFTHRCHEIHGNDMIGLIKAVTGKNFSDAVEYLKQFGSDFGGLNYLENKRRREMENFMKSYDTIKLKHKSVNEESLNKFKSLRSNFFLKQGFSNKVLDRFEIAGGWSDSQNVVRDIIPIRDDFGELVAYSLRDTRPNVVDDDFKYILTPGFDKQNCLYNMNVAQEYGDRLPIIVVEGFKSVWRLHEYGINNVVAVMGSRITEGQIFILCLYAMKGVVVMFDNDSSGAEGIKRACEDLKGKMDVFPIYIQELGHNGKGLDPADLTREQIYEYLETYYML